MEKPSKNVAKTVFLITLEATAMSIKLLIESMHNLLHASHTEVIG